MSEKKDRLLRLRSKKNKRRPKFLRAEWHRLKRIQTTWRRPRGIDSKMRHKLKGKRKSPNVGYRNPKLVRGLHPSGFEIVRVHNLDDLQKVDPDTQVAQIGRTVGSRKRTLIIERAEEMEIHILNPIVRRHESEFTDEEFSEDDFEFEDEEDELLEDALEEEEPLEEEAEEEFKEETE